VPDTNAEAARRIGQSRAGSAQADQSQACGHHGCCSCKTRQIIHIALLTYANCARGPQKRGGPPIIEHMFENLDDAGVVDAITDAARAQNAMYARELAAIGELYARRAPADDADRFNWAVEGYENVVAEVAAALRTSRGRAAARLHYAIALRERLPRVAEVFARRAIDFRLMAALVYRTELVEDPGLIANLDATVARHAPVDAALGGESR